MTSYLEINSEVHIGHFGGVCILQVACLCAPIYFLIHTFGRSKFAGTCNFLGLWINLLRRKIPSHWKIFLSSLERKILLPQRKTGCLCSCLLVSICNDSAI